MRSPRKRSDVKSRYRKDRDIKLCIFDAESGYMERVDGSSGVELTSRVIASVAERPTYTGEHEVSDATIKEIGWDLSRVVARPTLVTTFQWPPATMSGVAFTAAVPGSLQSMAFAKIPFQSFLYWRGDVVLNLQVAGSPLVSGIIAMSFVPLLSFSELQSLTWDLSSLTINPTVYLYANANTSAQLRIPFNHPQAYINSSFPSNVSQFEDIDNNLGFAVIYIVEPLLTAAASSVSVSVSLFSHLENSEFKVPQLSSTIEARQYEQRSRVFKAEGDLLQSLFGTATNLLGMTDQGLDPMLQDIGKTAKGVMDKVTNILPGSIKDMMGAKAMPSNFHGDVIDVVSGMLPHALSFLGLDNPTHPVEEGRMIVKGNGNLNSAVGCEYIEKLSVMPSGMALVSGETFATVSDEMDVGYLYRKFSYLGRFEVHKGDAIGKIVWQSPLSPMPTLTQNSAGTRLVNVGTYIQSTVSFPLLSYLGLPYRYWTGGLRYKFMVSATSMHSCKLFVSFNYNVWGLPTTLLDAASQYGIAFELNQGSNEFEFTVEYVSPTPYKNVSTGNGNLTNAMGNMCVSVLNELVAPSSVPDTISVAVFICGGEDFSYEYLAGVNPAIPVYDPTMTGMNLEMVNQAELKSHCDKDRYIYQTHHPFVAESGVAPTNIAPTVTDVSTGDTDDGEDIQIAPPQSLMQVDGHFGITGISLRNMLKKYQMVGRYPLLKNIGSLTDCVARVRIGELLKTPTMGVVSPYTTKVPQKANNGLLTWAGAMYRQWKGSLRFKAIFNGVDTGTTPSISPFTGASVYFLPGPWPKGPELISDTITMLQTYGPLVPVSGGVMPNINSVRTGALAATTSNILEFEVPYASQYLSVVNSSDTRLEYYPEVGDLIFVLNLPPPAGSAYYMQLYMAIGDETRFGNLYRVPLVYVPGEMSVAGAVLTPVSNIGFGDYGIPSSVENFVVLNAESRLDPETQAFNPYQASKPKLQVGQLKRLAREEVKNHGSLRFDELSEILTGVSALDLRDYRQLVDDSGIVVGIDGVCSLAPPRGGVNHSRFRPIRNRAATSHRAKASVQGHYSTYTRGGARGRGMQFNRGRPRYGGLNYYWNPRSNNKNNKATPMKEKAQNLIAPKDLAMNEIPKGSDCSKQV